jgi:6-phosphogluconate dehydrogenase
MGGGMARRWLAAGHAVSGYDADEQALRALAAAGLRPARSLPELTAGLELPHTVWLMLPPGAITEEAVQHLANLLDDGDTVVDGGNSHYRDSQRRAALLAERGVHFLDVGTNSGVAGQASGYCLTVGGESEVVARLRPLFEALATDGGWGHVGRVGAGHFAKMVHNAIMYGLMQSYGEGFALLQAKAEFELPLYRLASIWSRGSLVQSAILDLTAAVLARDEGLDAVQGWVPDTGGGRWAAIEALELDVSAPVITDSLLRRVRSRESASYADRLLAALRGEFGGHEVAAAQPRRPRRPRKRG